MKFFETEHERKSFAISVTLFVLMFILFFFIGLKYLDPPVENGIAINFGNSEVGSGDLESLEVPTSEPQPSETAFDEAPADEQVLTQEVVETPVVKELVKKEEVKKEDVKKEEAKKVPAPTPSKNTSDALSSLINGPKTEGTAQAGQGNDKQSGNKGSLDGNAYSPIYFGSGSGTGLGSGNSWGLKGRKLAGHSIVEQKCNEQGRVVVQVWVNRSGKVVKAQQAKGTENAAQCLIDAAIQTAKSFNWHPEDNAPEVQVGFIVVNFKLG